MILVYAQMCTELHKDERKNKKKHQKKTEGVKQSDIKGFT